MSGPYFIELLSRSHHVLARFRHTDLPIRIGRAYDNDVILDDPHTAPHHAQIEATDEGLQVRDLGSQNGIEYGNQICQQLRLDGDRVFRLGHSRLRLRQSDYPVAEEKVDSTNHHWEGLRPGLPGFALLTLISIARLWLFNTEENTAINYVMALATVLGMAMLWAFGWALLNRLIDNQPRLGRHVFIVGCAYAAFEGWNLLSTLLGYAFSLEFLTAYSSLMVNAIIVVALTYHIITVVPHYQRRASLAGVMMVLLSWGFNLMENYQHAGILADELYMSQILPPGFRVSPNHSVESFLERARQLQKKADEQAKKPPKVSAGDGEE